MAKSAEYEKLLSTFTAEELRNHKQGLQMGDTEFEMSTAPYNNYTGGMPAAKARYHGFPSGRPDLNLSGYTVLPDESDESIEYKKGRYREPSTGKPMPVERDTVVGINGNASPALYAHEFGHLNNPKRSESMQRFVDAATAPDKQSWDRAVVMRRDLYLRKGRDITLEEAEKDLVESIYRSHDRRRDSSYDIYRDEIANGGKVPKGMQSENAIFKRSEEDNLDDYSKMRQEQVYWPKALRQITEKENPSD